MFDAFRQLLDRILEISSLILIPDWAELIGLIPTLLLIGLLGPLLSLIVVLWFVYVVRAPRRRLAPEAVTSPAAIVDGSPVYPAGEPYCPTHRLIHPSGTERCAVDRRDLVIACPKCGTGRPAHLAACGSCGLEIRMTARPRFARTSPPPGGAAAA